MKSPFKFLDAYTLADKDHFFGRRQEIDELYRMVFKTPLVLVYGLSGTGKTSLIQCGLASRFEGPDWYPILIRKREDINRSLREAVQAALPGQMPADLIEGIRQLYRHYLRPVFLLFDQFEELFILGTWDEQQQFTQNIRSILDAQLPCTILLIIREEYLGRLYHFEKVIPGLFDYRLRVEPMDTHKVKEVLTSSFHAFHIALDPPGGICLDLMIDKLSAGKSGIQLPYLQVYLDMLWQREVGSGKSEAQPAAFPPVTFTQTGIIEFGAIADVLEKFLRQQEVTIQERLLQTYPNLPEHAIRKVLDVFVSEEGTKRPVYYFRDTESKQIAVDSDTLALLPKLPAAAVSDCLTLLEQSRLIRFRDDVVELAHDSLAALIDEQRTDEQRQLNEVKRRIRNNFQEYQQTGEFLSRKQLNAYEDYFDRLELDPPVREFIDASRTAVRRKERQEKARRRSILAAVATIAIMATVFAAYAVYQRNRTAELAFGSRLSSAEALKTNGNYEEAVAQLVAARDTLARTPEQKIRAGNLIDTYQAVAPIINRAYLLRQFADSLKAIPAADDSLILSLQLYEKVAVISPDALIRSRISETRQELIRRQLEFFESGQKIQEYAGEGTNARMLLKRAEKLREALEGREE